MLTGVQEWCLGWCNRYVSIDEMQDGLCPECRDMRPLRPTFLLKLRPEVGIDATRALKAALKQLLRAHGLRCLEISEVREKIRGEEPTQPREPDHTAATPAPKPAATLGRRARPTS